MITKPFNVHQFSSSSSYRITLINNSKIAIILNNTANFCQLITLISFKISVIYPDHKNFRNSRQMMHRSPISGIALLLFDSIYAGENGTADDCFTTMTPQTGSVVPSTNLTMPK
jgi:hypothetical protein